MSAPRPELEWSGEFQEKRLPHPEEAERFYRALADSEQQVRVGMEASGQARWFERLLAELQFEVWIGDAATIQSKRPRKQKTDRQDTGSGLRTSSDSYSIQRTVTFAISSGLDEDNRYFNSGKQGVWSRTGYALASILARHDDGSRHVSVSQLGDWLRALFCRGFGNLRASTLRETGRSASELRWQATWVSVW